MVAFLKKISQPSVVIGANLSHNRHSGITGAESREISSKTIFAHSLHKNFLFLNTESLNILQFIPRGKNLSETKEKLVFVSLN